MGGSGTANTRLLPANALRPIEPLLIHPEVLDRSVWLDGRFHWLDADTQQLRRFSHTELVHARKYYQKDGIRHESGSPSRAGGRDRRCLR